MEVQRCKRCGELAKVVDYTVNPVTMKTTMTFRCKNGHEFKRTI
jgi:lysyl-tRNA synthetase class I